MTPDRNNLWIIAVREITVRARERSFLISTALMIAVIVIGAIIWSALAGRDGADKIGMVDGAPPLAGAITQTGVSTGHRVVFVVVNDAATAQRQVDDGTLKAAVLAGPGRHYTILSKSGTDSALDGVLHGGISAYQLEASLSQHGVTLTDLPRATIVDRQLEPAKPDVGQRVGVAMIGAILLMMAVMTGGVMVAVGVVEEKSSRIVEILLSSVRPLQLLWGKILGIGAISLGQVVLLGATALIAGSATGLLTIPGTAATVFAAVIVWFVLGFLFFAALYAAIGAMVSRQEELNGASTPLTFLALGVLYSGIFGIQALDATWLQVLSWVPPFSAVLMPIRIATGDVGTLGVIGGLAVMIAGCAAVVWAGARIYTHSVLRTGSRTSWSEVGRMLARRS